MKKVLLILAVVLMLSVSIISFAAAGGDPVGNCPPNWHMHEAHPSHDGHNHHHVGNDRDLNGDGYICAKHVTSTEKVHVHIDNNIPFND